MQQQQQAPSQDKAPSYASLTTELNDRNTELFFTCFPELRAACQPEELDIETTADTLETFFVWAYSEPEAAFRAQMFQALGFCQTTTPADLMAALFSPESIEERNCNFNTKAQGRAELVKMLRALFIANYLTIEVDKAAMNMAIKLLPRGQRLATWFNLNQGNHWPPNELLLHERRRRDS